jgi:hypothetical protein
VIQRRIVDEDVEAAEALDRGADEALGRLIDPQIGLDERRAELGGERGSALSRSTAEHE